MEHPKSRQSGGDGQLTRIGGGRQSQSVVVVAVDATRDLTLAALQYTLKNLTFNPGDILYVVGILHTTSSKLGNNKFNTIGKEAEFQKVIANNQEIRKLFHSNKLIPSVRIAVGPDRKVVTAKQAMELRATWLVLDKHFKDDKDYLIEHLKCNIIVLMGKNKVTMIKIELPHVENSRVLEWKARWKTALKTAWVLRYLEDDCHVNCLVHRDMRPTNILLTNESVPMQERENFGPVSKSNSIKAQEPKAIGNLAYYLAPEYGESGDNIPQTADVYAFGILLIEVISGRKANDTTKMPLTEWARKMIHAGKTLDLVDPRLRAVCDVEQATKMVDAAGRCINKDPARRPEIGEVFDILNRDTKNVGSKKGKATKDICNIPQNPPSKRSQVNPIVSVGNVDHLDGDEVSDILTMLSLETREDVLGQEGKASSSSSATPSSSQFNRDRGKSSLVKAPPPYTPRLKLSYDLMVAAHTPKEKISYNEMVG